MNKLNQLFVVATAAVMTSPVFAAGETVADLGAAVTTEMSPVKGQMIAVGITLIGVAALGFCIYKLYSMAKGRG